MVFPIFMMSAVAVVSLMAIVAAGLGIVQAGHQATPNAVVWRNYLSSFGPPREVQWQPCNTLSWEEDLAQIAFINWNQAFGHSTRQVKLGYNCDAANDANLRVWAMTATQMPPYCPYTTRGCLYPKTCVGTNGDIVNCRSQTVASLLQAYIVFNYVWFDYDPSMQNQPDRQIHFFRHEFGHGMGLSDGHVCGQSVMSGEGCIDDVHIGPPPNDVCTPDKLLGWGYSRC